jgi:cytochrome P450
MLKARFYETLLYLINHPLTTIVGEMSRIFGKIVYFPRVGYIIHDAKLGLKILNHPAFGSSGRGSMGGMITPVLGKNALVNMDGTPHRELKQKLLMYFGKKEIEQVLCEDAADLFHQLRTDLQAGKTVDLVPFVRQLTIRTNFSLLGIPPRQDSQFYEQIADLAVRLSALMKFEKLAPSPKDLAVAKSYTGKIFALLGDDLKNPKLQSLAISEEESQGLLIVLLVAGTETVTAGLPRLVALLVDSGNYTPLINQREKLPEVVDEGLRLLCPSPAILRGVDYDTEMDGYRFKKNRRVVVMLYTALKDKTYFLKPRGFEPHRTIDPAMRHMWFGNGAHFCLGFGLARREIETVLDTLLGLGQIQIVKRSYPRQQSFPGYTRLLIKLK